MKKIIILSLFIILSITKAFSATIVSQNPYIGGKIGNITALEGGFLIMIYDNSGNKILPSNANNASYGWLIIKESNKAMMTMALYCWSNNIPVTVYCKGTTAGDNSTGYGIISQIDPQG